MRQKLSLYLLSRSRIHRSEAGFSMAAAMLVVLVLVLASVAAVNRAGSGGFGSIFSSQSRQARHVAESGLSRIISQWNQERNRRLLVSGNNPGTWATANNPLVLNPCQPDSSFPTTAATTFGGTGFQEVVAGDSSQRFYLRSIEYISIADPATGVRQSTTFSRSSETAAFSGSTGAFDAANISLVGDRRGYIRLTVLGQVVRGGVVQSEAQVTREFQIVPKCCQRSFGPTFEVPNTPAKTHGIDMRSCPAGGLGNFGLVVGLNGDGSFDSKGNSLQLWAGNTSTPLRQMISLNDSEDCSPLSDCQISWGGNTTVVNPLQNVSLPALPTAPASIQGAGCINTKSDVRLPYDGGIPRPGSAPTPPTGNCDTTTTKTSTTVYTYDSKATATKSKGGPTTYSCTVSGTVLGSVIPGGSVVKDSKGNVIASADPTHCYSKAVEDVVLTTPTPYCVDSGGEYHCLIRFIEGSNGNLIVDSTVQPVNLYLYDATTPPNSGDPASGTIEFKGSGGLSHVNCNSFSTSCSTDATLDDAARFAMFGSVDPQSIDLRGSSSVLAGFFYFPFGDVEVRGGGGDINIEGILWTNNLTLKGGVEFLVPQTGANCSTTGTVCNVLSDLFFGGGSGSNDVFPNFDWIARSVSTSLLF